MTDERALRQAVIAAPGDDTPRKVLADWLLERGREDEAKFVLTQLELFRRGVARGKEDQETWELACDACDLAARLPSYPRDFGGYRFKERPLDAGGVNLEYEYPRALLPNPSILLTRGFADAVSAPLAVLRGHLPTLAATDPIRSVSVSDRLPFSVYAVPRSSGESGWGFGVDSPVSWVEQEGHVAEPRGLVSSNGIPSRLFRLLAGNFRLHRTSRRDPWSKLYRSRDEANLALAQALLDEARQKANLPPVPRLESR